MINGCLVWALSISDMHPSRLERYTLDLFFWGRQKVKKKKTRSASSRNYTAAIQLTRIRPSAASTGSISSPTCHLARHLLCFHPPPLPRVSVAACETVDDARVKKPLAAGTPLPVARVSSTRFSLLSSSFSPLVPRCQYTQPPCPQSRGCPPCTVPPIGP